MYDFKATVDEYYRKIEDGHRRFLSWEHCYLYFYKNREKIDSDYGALMLFSYLASWGMLRGSFLMNHDYKIHKELVEKLTKEHGILWNDINSITWQDIKSAYEEILKYYEKFKENKNKCTDEISPVLRTKILLGIFGCTPAYDRFFKKGIDIYNNKNECNLIQKFGENSYQKLCDFYSRQEKLELNFHTNENLKYPPMKLIDMFFWEIGLEAFEEEKRKFKNNKYVRI